MPTNDPDAYWKALALQAQTRSARLALGSETISNAFGRGGTRFMENDRKKRFSRRRSLDWALTVAVGAALCAGVLYLTLGMHPHSPV